MKSLRHAAEDYIRMRRHLGFKMRHEERRLKRFVSFMEQERSPYITTKLALKWATEPANAQRATWAERLMCVRVFARYCSSADPRTEVPPPGILPFHPQRATPLPIQRGGNSTADGGGTMSGAKWRPTGVNLPLPARTPHSHRFAYQ